MLPLGSVGAMVRHFHAAFAKAATGVPCYPINCLSLSWLSREADGRLAADSPASLSFDYLQLLSALAYCKYTFSTYLY